MTMLIILMIMTLSLLVAVIFLLRKKEPTNLSAEFDSALKTQFLAFQQAMHADLDRTRSQVESSKDLLANYTQTTLKNLQEMEKTIQKIIQQQEETQKLGQSLKDLMQVPKLRGSFGETVLEEMLERVLPKGIWEKQYSIEGQQQVDFVVKFKDVIIPIDSKFVAREAYQMYFETEDKAQKSMYWKKYVDAIKKEIKSIREKYIKPEKGTTDYALMFIPSEATYYETIAEENYLGEPSEIYQYARDNQVIPVSPNTFYAFLQIIVMGIKNLEIVKSAKILRERLTAMQKNFDWFYSKYEEIGKGLEKAGEAFRIGDKHVKEYKKKLDDALQLEELYGEEIKVLPEDITEDEN